MLRSFFKTIFYFVLLAAVFWGSAWFSPSSGAMISLPVDPHYFDDRTLPLVRVIAGWVMRWPSLGIILSALLVFVNSFFITRIVIRNVVLLEKTYMPSIIYLLVSSGYFNSPLSVLPLLSSLMVLTSLDLAFKTFQIKGLASGRWLSVGFFLGAAATFYAPALLLVILLPIALSIFRLFDLREWVSALAGWFLPVFFCAYFVWMAGGSISAFFEGLVTDLSEKVEWPSPGMLNSFEWTFIGALGLLFCMSLFLFFRRMRSYKLKSLKVYFFFLWMLVAISAVMIFMPAGSLFQLPLLAIPLAVIIPTFFNSRKAAFVSNFLYVLMIGCALIIHLLPFFL